MINLLKRFTRNSHPDPFKEDEAKALSNTEMYGEIHERLFHPENSEDRAIDQIVNQLLEYGYRTDQAAEIDQIVEMTVRTYVDQHRDYAETTLQESKYDYSPVMLTLIEQEFSDMDKSIAYRQQKLEQLLGESGLTKIGQLAEEKFGTAQGKHMLDKELNAIASNYPAYLDATAPIADLDQETDVVNAMAQEKIEKSLTNRLNARSTTYMQTSEQAPQKTAPEDWKKNQIKKRVERAPTPGMER